ncbi:MAG: ABC transporter ATP-binding protein [Bacteroidales bacterium]
MLEIQGIKHRAGSFVLGPLSLKVAGGEYWVIAGPSGAGKSMLLEVLAGIREAQEGKILFDGQEITRQPVSERRFGLVFQDMALFPHFTVKQNIAYPIRMRGLSKEETEREINHWAEVTGVKSLLHRRPESLSGGEARRVAIARTLALRPHLLLLDEPFSGVDAEMRHSLYQVLKKLRHPSLPIIHVTHDPDEALSLATHLAVIKQGQLVQVGPIQEVFLRPTDEFVARYAGIRNFYPCELLPGPGEGLVHARLDSNQFICLPAPSQMGRGHISISVADIVLSVEKLSSSARNRFYGTITEMVPVRHGIEVIIDCGFQLAALISHSALLELDLKPGARVWASFKASAVQFIPD